MSPSWLPVAGEAPRNVFYAIGCHGHGHGHGQAPYLAGNELHDDLARSGGTVRDSPLADPSTPRRCTPPGGSIACRTA
ncbi:hypothetical protein [Streptomyces sp. TLI_105]|uniref:hypothetical protein n=1 Tax=Streptomyces sp. TLI_105 TaxID=1881019 RepID=UPI0008955BBD|nr:hypothetical protein [Streptomyces sp. TLI_105]SEB66011.1 hypothetical protein SAMN05428939_0355 [Streptomyces sp. TLI_105]